MSPGLTRSLIVLVIILSVVSSMVGWQLFFMAKEQRHFIAEQEKFYGDDKTKEGLKLLLRKADDVSRGVDKFNIILENIEDITTYAKVNNLPHLDEFVTQGTGTLKSGQRLLDSGRVTLEAATAMVNDLTTGSHKVLSTTNEAGEQLVKLLKDPAILETLVQFSKEMGSLQTLTARSEEVVGNANVSISTFNAALPKLLVAVQTVADNSGNLSGNAAVDLGTLNQILTKIDGVLGQATKPQSKTSKVAGILLQVLIQFLRKL